MKITVDLDGGLVAYLRERAGLRGTSFDEVVNEALRRYVSQAIAETPRRPYRVQPISSEFAADLDLSDPKAIKNLLADLDDEHFLNVQRYGAGDPERAELRITTRPDLPRTTLPPRPSLPRTGVRSRSTRTTP